MHSWLVGAFLALLGSGATAQTDDRWSVTVGEVRDYTDNVARATVVNLTTGPGVMLYVRDRHGIKSAAVFMSASEFRNLRALLDRAQAAVDAAAAVPAAAAMGAAASAARR